MILSALLMALFDITRGLFENLGTICLVIGIIFVIWGIYDYNKK